MAKKQIWSQAEFITSSFADTQFPTIYGSNHNLLKEIAVCGRSNVGKSTLLNSLFGTKTLVKTSATPGKTQSINFFKLDDFVTFVDLPGYGFAQVPMKEKMNWAKLIQGYIMRREQLALFLILLDVRRLPNEDDLLLINWAKSRQMPYFVVFTKTDKVTQKERTQNVKKTLDLIFDDTCRVFFHSSKTNEGQKELQAALYNFIKEPI